MNVLNIRYLRRSALGCAFAGGVCTLALLASNAEDVSVVASPFAWFALVPYAALFLSAWIADSIARATYALVCGIIVLGIGAWLYIEALFVHPGAQSGVAFVWTPLFQLVFALSPVIATAIRRVRIYLHYKNVTVHKS